MTTEQEKLYKLLDEIASACTKHKVNYYLIGAELLWTVRKKNHMRCRADVCMTFESYKAIAPDLAGLKDRVIESLYSNRDLPGIYFRYVDTTSFMLEPEYHNVIKEFGIAVNVHILRCDGADAEETERLEMIMDGSIEGVSRKISGKGKEKLNSLKKSDDYPDRMEEMLSGCSLKNDSLSDGSRLKLPGQDAFIFPGGLWEKTDFVTVAGRKYMTVKAKEEYLRIHYGNPEEVIPHPDTFLNRVMVDADIPYSEVADDILAELDDSEYWENRIFLFEEYFERYDKYVKERSRLEAYMRAAAERIYLWKKYYPIKDKIRGLWKDRRIDELRLVFEEMESSIKRFEPHGFLCVFDKDIWGIYLDMLKAEGHRERVKELEGLYEEGVFGEVDEVVMRGFL